VSKKVKLDSLSSELQSSLLGILRDCEQEDKFIRSQQVRNWKKLEEFWHGIQYIYWDAVAQDWRVPTQADLMSEETRDNAGPFYDYVVNIYKAHGESIIAALSIKPPTVEYFPDDADEPKDILAAKSKTKAAILVQKRNKAKLLMIDALHKLFNQGIVCGYTYDKADIKFGTKEVPIYETKNVDIVQHFCPNCMAELGESEGVQEMNTLECPNCGEVTPYSEPNQVEKEVITGTKDLPKTRRIVELFGPLQVKISFYIKEQSQAGYLIYYSEQHPSFLKSLYEDKRDDIPTEGGGEESERWSRMPSSSLNPRYGSDEYSHLITVKKAWFRPWLFEKLPKEDSEQLQKLFSDGAYLVFIGDKIFDAYNESMDGHWSIGKAGPSSYIHSDPMGQSIIPIQELKNNLVNLTAQSIEYGIPADFADPAVLDFDEYGKQEASPGTITPAKPRPGQKIGDSFYQMRTATLSREVDNFANRLDQDGQFVLGSFPSIYGGPSEGKSRTLGEYEQSRAMALQRLSIAWTLIKEWWADLVGKATDGFIESMDEEEKYVEKEGESFVNVIVRKADLVGKTAPLEAEVEEEFPITSAQKRALLMNFIQLNSDMINAVIQHPENVKNISHALGFPDLHIPGEDQRVKQLLEIKELLSAGPLEGVVTIEPQVDDDAVHVEVAKAWLCSMKGQETKKINPEGYQNIIGHVEQHQQALQAKVMAQFEGSPPGETPESAGVGVQ